ncbi:MAG TPA: UDP-N-acetylmuramoyl-tripeptide--D-alanyl-D-alanine ligase [Candidatus Dojkabacteria bacterium]|nr:UDP-N-acetylmuramoyl-tripeptide--D-alanyl-D-alanine ligase [Candidatus Dojkabacteria bacterium]
MKIYLKDIKERYPEFEIRNYDEGSFFVGFNHDSRCLLENEIYVPIKGERFDGHDFIVEALDKGASMSICEKNSIEKISNVSKPVILVDSIEEGLQKIVNFAISDITAPIIAITGSTGKTTTKQMLAAILGFKNSVLYADHFNTVWGNAMLLSRYENEDFVILECAMDRKGEIAWHANTFDPDLGIILNIGHVHAEKIGSIEEIYEEKKNLADYLDRAGKPLIINIDDERLRKLKDTFKSELLTYGKSDDAMFKIYDITLGEKGTDFNFGFINSWYTVHINAFGEGMVYDAMAAIIAGYKLGISIDDCIRGILNFSPNSGRFEIEKFGKDIIVVNDAYNANPSSMSMSLDTFTTMYTKDEYYRIVVLGDMKELGDVSEKMHKELGEKVKEMNFNQIYYVGDMFDIFGIGKKLENADEVSSSLEQDLKRLSGRKVAVLLKASNSVGLSKIPEYLRKLGL